MTSCPLLRQVDAVTIPVPDLDLGLVSIATSSVTACCGATTRLAKPG
jgi:hypothetical protein